MVEAVFYFFRLILVIYELFRQCAERFADVFRFQGKAFQPRLRGGVFLAVAADVGKAAARRLQIIHGGALARHRLYGGGEGAHDLFDIGVKQLFGGEGFLFPFLQGRALDLVQLIAQDVHAAGALRFVAAQRLDLRLQGAVFRQQRCQLPFGRL